MYQKMKFIDKISDFIFWPTFRKLYTLLSFGIISKNNPHYLKILKYTFLLQLHFYEGFDFLSYQLKRVTADVTDADLRIRLSPVRPDAKRDFRDVK